MDFPSWSVGGRQSAPVVMKVQVSPVLACTKMGLAATCISNGEIGLRPLGAGPPSRAGKVRGALTGVRVVAWESAWRVAQAIGAEPTAGRGEALALGTLQLASGVSRDPRQSS